MRYAWIITKDHQAEPNARPGTNSNAGGMTGPSDAPADLLNLLVDGKGRPFRLYDDDDELYYEGRIVTTDDDIGDEHFGPLDDFGTGNAGCTSIRYKIDGSWVRI